MGTTADKLSKLLDTKADIKAAIVAQGQSVADTDTFASYADKISAIKNLANGTADATAAAGDILSGKTAYVKGAKVTGTIATKTSSNLSASGATVTVPAGYYASQATKSVATATQAAPSISVDSAGKITASATQSAGYVAAGTKSATKQLTTQAAKTVTPSKSSQTAVAKNVYTTGAVTVAAIPDAYQDVSGVTAGAADVLTGKVIVNANGTKVTGTMTNNGAKTAALNAGKSYTIPAGYHNGSGKVTANSLASQTSGDATAADILSGKTAWVNGTKITGTAESGAEYEIITIQTPTSSGVYGNYTLERITKAVGAAAGAASSYGSHIVDTYLYGTSSNKYPVTYSGGEIKISHYQSLDKPITLLLINDPAQTAIST